MSAKMGLLKGGFANLWSWGFGKL